MLRFFQRKKDAINKVFGDVKRYDSGWGTSVKPTLELWGKTYKLSCTVVVGSENPEISQPQEDIYAKFIEERVLIQGHVENIVSDYYNVTDPETLISKFGPYELMITPNLECTILASNADDEDIHDVLPGLAVVVYPRMAIFTEEDYSEYALRGGANHIKEKLYGG